MFDLVATTSHLALAVLLFFCVNWIGKHAVDFGYGSSTLFEDVNENLALNFFLRAMSPAVFIIAASGLSVATGNPQWRFGIFWVAVYYYFLRALVIFILNRQRLVSWTRFCVHAAVGVAVAMLAYQYLILPNRSLLPDIDDMGNELWLAILFFLYAVSNNVPVQGGPGAKRRNNFLKVHYSRARAKFSRAIDENLDDEKIKLIVYAVILYEDYARPTTIRTLERLMFWKRMRTTGIMQVKSSEALSDAESVIRGASLLKEYWARHASEELPYYRVRNTIAEYNADDDYVGRVLEIMEILAKRVDKKFLPAYQEIWGTSE